MRACRLDVRGSNGGLLLPLAAVCLTAREPYALLPAEAALLGFAGVGFFVSLGADHPRIPQSLTVNGVHALLGLLRVGFRGW